MGFSHVFRLPSASFVHRLRARARSDSGLLHVRMEIMKAEREIAHAHAHERAGFGDPGAPVSDGSRMLRSCRGYGFASGRWRRMIWSKSFRLVSYCSTSSLSVSLFAEVTGVHEIWTALASA